MKHTNNVNVILIRHAQSTWNAESRFTGWANPDLTDLGVKEAQKAAEIMKERNLIFDSIYTSMLLRAKHTAEIILDATDQNQLPITQDWRLNERHYGALQGLNKNEIGQIYGEQQVLKWRRGFHDRPDPMQKNDRHHPRFDPLYSTVPENLLPSVESLADTQARAIIFWNECVLPDILNNRKIFISAHGNTLRALIMHLSGMSIHEVETFEIPTGTPISYEFTRQGKAVAWEYLKF